MVACGRAYCLTEDAHNAGISNTTAAAGACQLFKEYEKECARKGVDLEGASTLDKCGVCHGDSSSCTPDYLGDDYITCDVIGHVTVKSFDNVFLDLPANTQCDYTVAKSPISFPKEYLITADVRGCNENSSVTCIPHVASVSITAGDSVELFADGRVVESAKGGSIQVNKRHTTTIVSAFKNELKVEWSDGKKVTVSIAKTWTQQYPASSTRGLCGDADGDKENEHVVGNATESNKVAFAYEHSDGCSVEAEKPCPDSRAIYQSCARQIDEVAGGCKKRINPVDYIKTCEHATCSCGDGEMQEEEEEQQVQLCRGD
jgi:hypothetical protein